MDNLKPEQRKYCMSHIKSGNTESEMIFRKYLWANNIRGYTIKAKIKGKPDLYFPKKKIAVFIDGCFWHKCPQCFVKPKSKLEYWDKKIARNVERDKEVNLELEENGITVLRFWEHQVKKNIDECFNSFINVYEEKTKNN